MAQHPAAQHSSVRSDITLITGSTPRLELNPRDRKQIVRKIRTLENYLGVVSKMTNGVANYIVGSGIRPVPITDNDDFNKAVAEDWKDWAENPVMCDRTARQTIYDMQHSAAAGEIRDGEAFSVFQKTKNGIPQLLTVDPLLVGSTGFTQDRSIVDGVRIDSAGKPLGIHVNSSGATDHYFSGKTTYLRRNQYVHLCDFRKAHQTRGKSCLHSAANHLHDIIDLLALEKQATKTHQSMAVHVKRNEKTSMKLGDMLDGVDDAINEEIENDKIHGKSQIQGATVFDDSGIDDISLLTSNRPNSKIVDFLEFIIREAASAIEMPYEFIWSMAKIGGAPARYVLIDAYATIKKKQLLLERQFNFPVYRWWLASMIKNGKYGDLDIPDKWWKVEWKYPARVTMDIKHDGRQLIDLLKNGLTTETEIYEGAGLVRGVQVDRRIAEIREVMDKCESAKVPIEYYYQQMMGMVDPETEEEIKKEKPKEK